MNAQTPQHEKLAKKNFFADLKIGTKLSLGFGFLVALIFISAVVSYVSSANATVQIQRTDAVRVPTALLASRAQANLLRMLADVRGYLALGDPAYRTSYDKSAKDFEADLAELKKSSPSLGADGQARLDELQKYYEQWKPLPAQLFELRDDQLDREPAYKMLATDGVLYAGQVIINTSTLITQQGQRDPSKENLALMADMSKFQNNFSAILSAMRGYVTTRNRIYRGEYEVNVVDNQNAWERLFAQKGMMTDTQKALLENIAKDRQSFLDLPEKIFDILESDRWREDLYLFTNQAVPLADQMDKSLNDLVQNQQTNLRSDLSIGRRTLELANQFIIGSGIAALILGLLMTFASRRVIAQPISRLTDVAEQIRGGDLEAQAKVESRDEIGVLASTFNNMTTKLRQTLTQVRKEKKRADDLLEVVIPIGVELTTEKNFNRLLEKMLLETKTFCNADTGILYMSREPGNLEFVIVRSDSRNLALGGTTGAQPGYAPLPLKLQTTGEPNLQNVVTHTAIKGATINISTADQVNNYDLWGADEKNQSWSDYPVNSMLTIPLKDSSDQVLGILQLINAKDPDTALATDFDENLQEMMESFSSLAVAALEAYTREFKLKQEIQQLRIEIDEVKQKQQLKEIVETDFFQNLTARAKDLRERRKLGNTGETK
jgi:CHASE3 domain sensor protein